MFTSVIDSDPDGILDSEDTLPVMVDTISPASVPSFAPGFAAISAAGLFVAGLMLASRRREEEEELESLSLVDDEQAVSPVIATILMVAITVVLSGVVYVWASNLADQPSKSVPRIAFKVEKNSPGLNGYWSIIVTSAKEPIATQATVVMLEWVNGSGSQLESFRLDNTEGIYGFAPINSESFVTFSDSIECDSPSECTSTYGDGDAIHIKMSDESGYLLDDGIRVTLKYVPIGAGNAFVLKTFNLEI
jgi:flagellin-like protein